METAKESYGVSYLAHIQEDLDGVRFVIDVVHRGNADTLVVWVFVVEPHVVAMGSDLCEHVERSQEVGHEPFGAWVTELVFFVLVWLRVSIVFRKYGRLDQITRRVQRLEELRNQQTLWKEVLVDICSDAGLQQRVEVLSLEVGFVLHARVIEETVAEHHLRDLGVVLVDDRVPRASTLVLVFEISVIRLVVPPMGGHELAVLAEEGGGYYSACAGLG